MSSRLAVKQHSAPARKTLAPVQVTVVRPTPHADAAAHEETANKTFSFSGDPLLGMAVASVIMFLVFAALMASF